MRATRKAIGILRETKNKWERRVPLIPSDVRALVKKGVQVLIQPSNKRIFLDHEYRDSGAVLTEDLSPANTILGVKEIPPSAIIPNRSYILFNHVIKAQSHNMPFLDACMASNVRLFDYETIRATKDAGGQRLVAFGKFAGLAGMIDGLRGLGDRLLSLGYQSPFMGVAMSYTYPTVEMAKRAISEMGNEIATRGMPDDLAPMVFVFTGSGNVANGSLEIFKLLPHEMVTPAELPGLAARPIEGRRNKVYGCVISAKDMVVRMDGGPFDKADYYNNPQNYRPVFHEKIAPYTSVLVNGMYWDPRFPRLLSIQQIRELRASQRASLEREAKEERKEEARRPSGSATTPRPKGNRLGFLLDADITCDTGGSVEFLKRISTLEAPFYLYNPETDQISPSLDGEGIVMGGVDNLPAQFPREASSHFSKGLAPFVEALASSDHTIPFAKQGLDFPPELRESCIVADGKMTPPFEYITKLRESTRTASKSSKETARTGHEVESNILLEGHLFDTGFINKALDLLEVHGQDFKVVHWDITPNRTDRKQSVSRAVVHVTASDAAKLATLMHALDQLVAVVPFARGKISKLPSGTYVDHLGEQRPLPTSAASSSSSSSSSSSTSAPSATKAPTPSGKKVLVLGAGYVAAPLVEYLAGLGHAITVGSLIEKDAQAVIAGQPNCRAVFLDSSDKAAVDAAVSAVDMVISLLPATQHVDVAQMCINRKKNMVTASYVSPAMRLLDQDAKNAGITIMNEVGLDPGIDHMSAMKVIDEVRAAGGKLNSFESWCGGLPAPEASDNPLGYKFSWSPLGVLTASQNAATWRSQGKVHTVLGPDLLRSARAISINPAFKLEHLPNRDSLSYASAYGCADVATMYRGTLRYEGFSSVLDAIARLGLLDAKEQPLPQPASWANVMATILGVRLPASGSESEVRSALESAILGRLISSHTRGARATVGSEWSTEMTKAVDAMHWLGLTSPTQFVSLPVGHKFAAGHHSVLLSFCELLKQKLVYQGAERDMVLLYHKFGIAWPDGREETRTSTLISYGGDGGAKPLARVGAGGGVGYSAMARTVGLPTAMAARLILDRKLTVTGVLTPLIPQVYNPLLALLKQEGIECIERST